MSDDNDNENNNNNNDGSNNNNDNNSNNKIKIKIYLDTSVVSCLAQEDDNTNRKEETHKLWEILKTGKYEIILSSALFEELELCQKEKRNILSQYLTQIKYTKINSSNDIEKFANNMILSRILTENHWEDCLHIATAVLSGCGFIISWNFKHFVKDKTRNGVKRIALSKNCDKFIDILSPRMLLKENN